MFKTLVAANLLLVGLLGALAVPVLSSETATSLPPAAVAERPLRNAIDEAPPVDIFLAALARPLFSPTRGASPPEEGTSHPDAAPRLIAVVMAPGRNLAVFARSGDDPQSVRVGGDIEGWTVTSIRRDGAMLEKSGETLALTLGADGAATIQAVETAAAAAPIEEPERFRD